MTHLARVTVRVHRQPGCRLLTPFPEIDRIPMRQYPFIFIRGVYVVAFSPLFTGAGQSLLTRLCSTLCASLVKSSCAQNNLTTADPPPVTSAAAFIPLNSGVCACTPPRSPSAAFGTCWKCPSRSVSAALYRKAERHLQHCVRKRKSHLAPFSIPWLSIMSPLPEAGL